MVIQNVGKTQIIQQILVIPQKKTNITFRWMPDEGETRKHRSRLAQFLREWCCHPAFEVDGWVNVPGEPQVLQPSKELPPTRSPRSDSAACSHLEKAVDGVEAAGHSPSMKPRHTPTGSSAAVAAPGCSPKV